MKPCAYCGRQNADEAVNCRECGTEFERPRDPPPEPPPLPGQAEYKLAPLSAADRRKDLVTLITCGSLLDADAIAARLRAGGIPAFIPDENLMQAMGWNLNAFGYVRVQIPPKDYEAAKDLLGGLGQDA